MARYEVIHATFDSVKVGDKIKRRGVQYYIAGKITDNRGGYVEVRPIKVNRYCMIQPEVWTREEFDKRGFLMVQEPVVSVTKEENRKE